MKVGCGVACPRSVCSNAPCPSNKGIKTGRIIWHELVAFQKKSSYNNFMPDATSTNSKPQRYPRVEKLIAWLRVHQAEIETPEKFSLTLHFGGSSIVPEKNEKFPVIT